MGADNLAQFHHWQDWRQIMQTCPVGVLARPEARISARMSPAARIFANARVPGTSAKALSWRAPPAWCYVNVPLVGHSSTAIRAAGHWG
jgi:nicotinate-nucleotide adenylyltransferase